MLIYLNGIPLQGNSKTQRVQSALPLSRIIEVTEVEQVPRFDNKWVFSIRLDDGQVALNLAKFSKKLKCANCPQ